MRKLAAVIILSCCAFAAMSGQTVQDARALTPEAQLSPLAQTKAGDPRANLAKMRVLLGQMQRNVAFVSAGDTPLKHQLELEIEMWQLLIADMEQKLNAQVAAPAK